MKALSTRQILMLHDQLVAQTGGSASVRDEALLESALSTPFQSFGNEDAFPSLPQKQLSLASVW